MDGRSHASHTRVPTHLPPHTPAAHTPAAAASQYDEEDIFPRFTSCFNCAMISMFFPLIGALGVVPRAETMLRKDLASGAHRLSTW